MTATIASNSQATESYTSSLTFMKQLTVIAISTITCVKKVFPEDSYMMDSFGGIHLRILKNKCRDERAQFMINSLVQAFEAFDKRYLEQLALCFYEDEDKIENLIEYHIFDYSYKSDGVSMNVHSKNRDSVNHTSVFSFENVRERTLQLIRNLMYNRTCSKQLPSTHNMSLRLYYNDDAPCDYQAPGFACPDEQEDHLAGSLQDAIQLGWVETPFHKLVLRSYKETADASQKAIASQNPPTIRSEEVNPSDPSSDSRPRLWCPCDPMTASPAAERGLPAASTALLTCQHCRMQQHAECFGVMTAHVALVSHHCCADCHDADRSRHPTDTMLANLTGSKRQSLCLFRRVLAWCSQRPTVCGASLVRAFCFCEANAVKIMKLLLSRKVIAPECHDYFNTPHKIQKDHLKVTIDNFFNQPEHDNITERLVAETLSSQETFSDPLSDVLSPLERVSLRNASSAGRIVPPTGDGEKGGEDSTLKQYREAILSNDKVEELTSVTGVQGVPMSVKRKGVKRTMDEDGCSAGSGDQNKRARTLTK